MSANDYRSCSLCPRECKADRTKAVGFCGMNDKIYAAKAMVHMGEEPCISGTKGSGAIFFSGCTLGCIFCQNRDISYGKFGKEISVERLSQIMLELQAKGVHNINLVSGTHFLPSVEGAVNSIKGILNIPIVWNTGGYEKTDTVSRLSFFCDVFLQDLKFYDTEVSSKYAKASDYFSVALKATEKMVKEKGRVSFDEGNIIKSGVIVRHLVLPSKRHDSIKLLGELYNALGTNEIILSLMSQYTPPSYKTKYPELDRKITDFEYKSVCEYARELGFKGYFQERSSAVSSYTPCFDLEGL